MEVFSTSVARILQKSVTIQNPLVFLFVDQMCVSLDGEGLGLALQ